MGEKLVSNGYDSLMSGFILALEDNSKIIGDTLEALSEKDLSEVDKRELRKIKKELNKIDSSLSSLE